MTTTNAMNDALTEMLGGDLMSVLTGCFEQMEWAEDEIEKAQKRHPEQADAIYHSFALIKPGEQLGFERFGVEFVYRSHCRELLERVAAGHDTRPATAAEICIACSESSLVAPLTETATGLYARMWKRAGFPGDQFDVSDMHAHMEALHSSLIDDAESEMRRKLAVADRKPGDVECKGMHHGDVVACQYAKPATPVQLELAVA